MRTNCNVQAVHDQLHHVRRDFSVGLAHIFLQHTSAALTLNENCDPDVRQDLHDALERLAPRDGTSGVKYIHDAEGYVIVLLRRLMQLPTIRTVHTGPMTCQGMSRVLSWVPV